MEIIINVASKTSTRVLAENVLQFLQDHHRVELKAIGAGAVNQAVKAIAIAETKSTVALKTNFTFFSVTIDEQEKSGIRFEVKEECLNG